MHLRAMRNKSNIAIYWSLPPAHCSLSPFNPALRIVVPYLLLYARYLRGETDESIWLQNMTAPKSLWLTAQAGEGVVRQEWPDTFNM